MRIDAHSHLDRYDELLESALEEIESRRIFTLSNSMDIPSYEKNLEIAKKSDLVLPTFGVHPWNAQRYIDRLDELERAVEQSPLIGEIGLDHHFITDSSQFPAQLGIFEFFLQEARDSNKIVNIHTKGAEEKALELLRKYRIERVIVHWYSGPRNIFQDLVDFGAYFTVGISVLHANPIEEIAREVPLDRLLTETDNPGGWEWATGKVGMPSLIENVVRKIAELRGMPDGDVTRTIKENFARMIQDDPYISKTHSRLFEI